MKFLIILALVITAQPLAAQLDIEPLTGFSFGMTRRAALEQAKRHGGHVPESIQDERNLALNGMSLLGFPNSMVLVQFYKDQLYNVAVSINSKNVEEQAVIFEKLLDTLAKIYGKPFSAKTGMLFWMINPASLDSDRILLVRESGLSINVQFTNGALLKQAQPKQP